MLYTPIEVSLEGVFRGYTKDHYVLVKPFVQSDWIKANDFIESTKEDALFDLIAGQFISGVGLDADGKSHEISLEEFRVLLKHIGLLVMNALRPIQPGDSDFLAK